MSRIALAVYAIGVLAGTLRTCSAAEPGVHALAAAGEVARLENLIRQRPEWVETRDRRGNTPLHAAAGALQTGSAELLLGAGADVNARNRDGQTPLHVGMRVGRDDHERRIAFSRLLLEHGADARAVDERGRTPLHLAATVGDEPLLLLLVRAGAAVGAKDKNGTTPLHLAASYGNSAAIEWLLAHGAEVNAQDNKGETPLHAAVRRVRKSAVEELVAGGAAVNAASRHGTTALHVAATGGPDAAEVDALMTAISAVLLEHEANVNARDLDGHTPLDLALREKRTQLAELLRSRGGQATPD